MSSSSKGGYRVAMTNKRNKPYETFQVNRKLELYEKLFMGLESVFFVVLSFYAGFEFHRTESLLWLGVFIGILIGKFQWQNIKKITKKVIL